MAGQNFKITVDEKNFVEAVNRAEKELIDFEETVEKVGKTIDDSLYTGDGSAKAFIDEMKAAGKSVEDFRDRMEASRKETAALFQFNENDSPIEAISKQIEIQKKTISDLEGFYAEVSDLYNKVNVSTSSQELIAEKRKVSALFKEITGDIKGEKDALMELEKIYKVVSKEEQKRIKEEEKRIKEEEKASQKRNSTITQLRKLREEMTALTNADGTVSKENLAKYDELKNQLSDVGTAYRRVQEEQKLLTKAGSSTMMGLSQGLQGVLGTYTVFQGVTSMFVKDTSKFEEIQIKLASALSLTYGIQQASTALHSTSAFRIGFVSKATQVWTTAQNALNTSLGIGAGLSKALLTGGIMALVAGIGYLIVKYKDWSKEQEKIKKQEEEFNNVLMEGKKNAQDELVKLDLLYKATQDHNKSQEDRIKATKELQKLYPDYLGNLSEEEILAGNGAIAYKNLTESILQAATARAAQDKLVENAKEMLALDEQRIKLQKDLEIAQATLANREVTTWDTRVTQAQEFGQNYSKARIDGIEESIQAVNEQEREIIAQNERLASYVTLDSLIDSNKNKGASSKGDKAVKKQKDIIDTILAQYEKLERDKYELEKLGVENRIQLLQMEGERKLAEIEKEKQAALKKDPNADVSIFNERARVALAYYEQLIKAENKTLQDAEMQAMIDYNKKFGDYLAKREAIVQDYNNKIAKATTEGERLTFGAQMQQELTKLDEEAAKSSTLFAELFADASLKSVNEINSLIERVKELFDYLNTTDSADITAQFGFSAEQLKALKENPEQLKALQSALKGLYSDLENKSPFMAFQTNFKDAVDELKKGLKDGNRNSIGSGIAGIGQSIQAFAPHIQKLGEDVGLLFGEDLSKDIGNAVEALGGLGQTAQGVGQIIQGDVVGGAMNLVSGLATTINAVGNLFGSDGTAYYERVREQLEAINSVYEKIIANSKEEITFGGGFASINAASSALENYYKKLENLQKIADASGRSGAKWNSHSAEWHSNKNVGADNFNKMSQIVGKSIKSMNDLYYLTGDELYLLQSQMPEAWSKIDERIRENLESIIECKDEALELQDALNEALTGIDQDSFYNDFINNLSNLEMSFEDMCDNFEDDLRKSIMAALIADQYKDRINALYENWAAAAKSDGKITKEEAEKLKKENDDLLQDMIDDREKLREAFGWGADSPYSPKSSKGYQVTASQDSVDEVLGIARNMQMVGLNQEQELIKQTEILSTFGNGFISMQQELQGITSITLESMYYLRDIEKHTKTLNGFGEILTKIEKNTQ